MKKTALSLTQTLLGASIPVLCYHQVRPDSGMRPEKYGSHLDLIRKMGFETINLARLHDVITVKDKHTFPAIVITLNDCTLDNWVYAVPELFRQDMQGVFFAITNFLRHSRPRPRADQSGNIPIPRFDEIMNQTLQGNCECFMNHRELRALVHDLGMEVYSHSAAHQACFTAKKPIGTLGEAKHWSHKSLCGPNAKHDTPVYPAGSAYAHAGFGLDWNGRPLRIRDRKERLSLCEEGFRRAKNELETALDRPCPFICPPWGQFGTTTLAASVRAGYQPTLTLERTVVSPGSPRIGRITVKDAKNPTWLRNKLILHAHALPVKLFCSH
jgi:peptidoglycan/xylan/chitin deacetylase (PgdA/CDA1 family)